jgi:hypothetical protein
MAGPVATYLSTQLAAQTAFNVPFGLLSLVNSAINSATAAGEFNVTVDCSLFVTEDISNLRIYLDSLGYTVEFAKGTSEKSLAIDWGHTVPGAEVLVDQGTTPWIVSGTVTALQGTIPWVVSGSFTPAFSTTAITTAITVTTSPVVLLASNPARKGFAVQNTTGVVFIKLDSTVTTGLYSYELPRGGILEIENYTGPVAAITAAGSIVVMVTEKV